MNDTVEQRVKALEERMDNLEKQSNLDRDDINRFFDGTDENPGIFKRLDKLEQFQDIVLKKLDKLDHLEEIVKLLKEKL